LGKREHIDLPPQTKQKKTKRKEKREKERGHLLVQKGETVLRKRGKEKKRTIMRP